MVNLVVRQHLNTQMVNLLFLTLFQDPILHFIIHKYILIHPHLVLFLPNRTVLHLHHNPHRPPPRHPDNHWKRQRQQPLTRLMRRGSLMIHRRMLLWTLRSLDLLLQGESVRENLVNRRRRKLEREGVRVRRRAEVKMLQRHLL